ncbi:hypothetical protein EDD17DRAFT_1513580 [Pisolithus thermaeus]|nr:hypothetical protein EDD17DRAFT_1513580 [Pisolithus thermaeus]
MALKKWKHTESDVDNTQVDLSPPNALPVNHCTHPKRTGAGKGGATKQLKNCANAITHVYPKQLCVVVPSSEPVNKMVPVPSPKKACQHMKTQPTGKKSTDQHDTASSKIFVDPVRTPTKFATKPAFHLGDELSHFGFRGPLGCLYEILRLQITILIKKLCLWMMSTSYKIGKMLWVVQSEPEDRGHCSDTDDHLSDAGSIKGGSDDHSDKGDQGDSKDLDTEDGQQSAFRHGTPINSNDDIEANESLEEEDTDTMEVVLATDSQNRSELKCLTKYKQAHISLEHGMIPHYQEELYTVFRFIKIAPTFTLKLRSYLHEDKSIWWVHDQASQLIKGAKFLHCAQDAQGKEQNFTHKALYTISVAAYYGTSQKLLGWALKFKEYLPEAAIVLIAAGNGKIHNLKTTTEPINWKLQEQLERWAKCAG